MDTLAERIATYAARLDAGEHQLLTTIRLFEQLRGWAVQGATSYAAWLSFRIGVGLNTAREKVRVALALGELPRIDEAMRKGQLSYAKARAMTRVATPENEELLLSQARGTTGAQLERVCARFRRFLPGALTTEDVRYVHRRTSRDGTVKIEMSLLADEAEMVLQALEERRKQLVETTGAARGDGPGPTLVDAAVDIARKAGPVLDGAADGPSRPAGPGIERTLFVHLIEQPLAGATTTEGTTSRTTGAGTPANTEKISAEMPKSPQMDPGATSEDRQVGSAHRFHAELDDGTPICGATLRRLACDAGLIMAERSAKGSVLDVGRKRRTLTSSLARALQMRDRRCRFPGCQHRAFLDAHHIEHWSCGGETSLSNLVRLCHFHHLAVHEGGFDVRQTEDGVAFFDADGKPLPALVSAPRLDMTHSPLEQLALEQCGDELHIDGRTALPRSPGLSSRDIDMQGCVCALIRRTSPSAPVITSPSDARS